MKELLQKLSEKNLTLGSVESMTGGLFASNITDVAGASKVFKGSIVTYATEIKEKVVGVDSDLIKKHTVVSAEVAEEMARKGQKLLGVDVCISVTGNAGPTAEPGWAKVGCVYIGLMVKDKYYPLHLQFDNANRSIVRLNTIFAMRDLILEKI